MNYAERQEGKFKYLETGEGEVLMLLHGLFGALSNFRHLVDEFKKDYRVVIPILPLNDLPVREVNLENITKHVEEFVEHKGYDKLHVLGNSLGGHISLLYVLANQSKVLSLTLTGSSGLFERGMGSSMPQRGNYEYIRARTELTFYDPKMASKELVDEVYEIVNDRNRAVRVIAAAKSAIRHNLSTELNHILVPTLLLWGEQDNITPPFVGEEFHKLIPNSRLILINECGHAPMMERPEIFNEHLRKFFADIKVNPSIR